MGAGSPDAGFGSMAASQRAEMGVAERRQLTVMFCDLVGSTALAERHDPEDFGEVAPAFLLAARTLQSVSTAMSRDTWAMDCWSILATRRPRNTTLNVRFSRGWLSSQPFAPSARGRD